MPQRITYILTLVCLSSCLGSAQYFAFTPELKLAYNDVIRLKLNDAQLKLSRIKVNDPDNMLVYHIENYIDFFKVFISEDEDVFDHLKKNKKVRIAEIRKGDFNSPYYLYSQAEVHLQWALARLKFKEYLTAFSEVSKAYQLLDYNQKRFPDFVANKKSLGILHALVGTIPDNYKWGVRLLGMNGTINQGRQEIEEVLEFSKKNDFIFEEETQAIYAFVLLHLSKEADEAWSVLQNRSFEHQQNPLACFVKANIAMRTGRNDQAIKILEARPKGEEYMPFHYLDYMMGLAKLQSLDPDSDVYFIKYISNFKGNSFIKDAQLKLAWHDLLFNKGVNYQSFLDKCLAQGDNQIDEDASANKAAKSGIIPDVDLLKARLLYDGGFYLRAKSMLMNKPILPKNLIEYHYRLGRIYQALDENNLALAQYQIVLDLPSGQASYMAGNAALQMGIIHEQTNNASMSKRCYQQCLSMDIDEYQRSIHQKAKTGLKRLEKN